MMVLPVMFKAVLVLQDEEEDQPLKPSENADTFILFMNPDIPSGDNRGLHVLYYHNYVPSWQQGISVDNMTFIFFNQFPYPYIVYSSVL